MSSDMYQTSLFARFAKWAAYATGHPLAFLLAVGIILGWALTGPSFHFSDTWQLVINTGTTIITFLRSCTSSVRIIPQPEPQVVYHRFPRREGKRHGRQPPFP